MKGVNISMQTQEITSAVRTQGRNADAEPINLTKRIGSTNYRVSVYFSATSRETISDKITRLIKNDVSFGYISDVRLGNTGGAQFREVNDVKSERVGDVSFAKINGVQFGEVNGAQFGKAMGE